MAFGRPTIFGPKDPNDKGLHGAGLSSKGRQLFERSRAKLKKLAKWPSNVSDSDVIEMLVRGDAETALYLAKKQKEKTREQ